MSLYLKQIEQLVALQRVDSEIIAIKKGMEAAPLEVEALREEFAKLQAAKGQIEEKMQYLLEQAKRLDVEITDDSLKIKKSKNKLMMASNTKEYHAMMREMDNMEKQNRMREEERATLEEELIRQRTAEAAINEELQKFEAQLEEKSASLNARTEDAQLRLGQLARDRKQAGQSVPPPVLSRYEFIRSRLSAPVIVPVAAGVCSGCHIMIPPQSFIELQKGTQILSCPNCQRLIYWCEHFQTEEEAAAAAAAEEEGRDV
ncbi:zinc ribbon domain-containing protein [Megalodesulfovibrio paquesii]